MTVPTPGGQGPGGISGSVLNSASASMRGDHNVQNNYFNLSFPDPVETAAQKLAKVVLAQWRQEAAKRGLYSPVPIPVQWRAMPSREFGDHLHLSGDPGEGSAADLGSFARTFLGLRQRQRRLVVLGGAGSGKTTLAVLLVIEMLQRMGEGDPVPVLLSLASWRPRLEHLATWLERQLLREYPYLSVETVRILVRDQRVLPVLDGLDELPAPERPTALRKLNSALAAGGPVVLTCRTDDYAEAIRSASVLRSAAVVQADPLTAGVASDYLLNCAPPLHEDRWRPLTDALTRDPSSPVAKALSVPLLLWLCRIVYEHPDPKKPPGKLADPCSFPTAEAIERHLLDALVPSLYPSGPQPPPQPGRKASPEWSKEHSERVSHWLSYLARHLKQHGKPDLAWWELGTTMRRSSRMTVIGLVSGATVGLIVGLTDGLIYIYAGPARGLMSRLVNGLFTGLVAGLVNGLPAALVFALAHGIGLVSRGAALEPSRVQIRLRRRTKQSDARSTPEILARARIGLIAGFAAGVGIGSLTGLTNVLISGNADWLMGGLVDAAVYGLLFALAGGLAGGLMAWFEAPIGIESADPRGLLNMNRKAVLLQLLMFGPLLGLVAAVGGGLIVELLNGSLWGITLQWNLAAGLRFGFLIGLGGGLGVVLSLTAWGQWMVLARIWLPLTRRLPWAVMTFLEDAHQRGVLRQTGAVYQFRHARLQDRLLRPPEHRDR
ncbi:NACHT domain-containing protein [Streptomyces mirabilis]|uniref:NACHT domain-containing protein n=1 Tax=Streptomyces mirabilis TaxID=68239 RepID=UPI003807E2C3